MKFSLATLICMSLAGLSASEAATHVAIPDTSYKDAARSVATDMSIALPVLAVSVAISKHDRAGIAELLAGTVLSVGTAYALNNAIREERPDGSSAHSFPAETSALAASSSAFLWGRYGWQYGVPAYAASDLVSFSLTQAKRENWYDTFGGSLISTGFGLLVTRRLRNRYHINTSVSPIRGGGLLSFSYNW
jgi:hypothetical protein